MNDTTEMPAATRVIDLAELRGSDEFPVYAAVYSNASGNPFVLSADVMCWSRNVYISRLDDCRNFWLAQKKKQRCKLSRLFDPLLRYHYGDDYVAVFGNHPWQCLLYLHYQLKHDSNGLYFLHSPINRNIYKTLGWECWFDAQKDLADHLAAINARGFRRESLCTRQAQMRRFIERIGVANPRQMNAADANSIRRRFGKWLGLIWHWSFTQSGGLQDFPWVRLRQQKTPVVMRDLEYPVNQWSYVALLLREDLERLCQQFHQDDCEHINLMHWEITLFNCRKMTVELSFRHPYSLHRDRPGFDTALYQARYVYDDVMRDLAARDNDLDLPGQMPFIRWRLEVRERVLLAPTLLDLFAGDPNQVDYQRILALQNKLPLAFECYRANASFFPEQSFKRFDPDGQRHEPDDEYPWFCGAANKPLFYYHSPLPIEVSNRVQRVFLERNSNQWWLGRDALQSIRDYFLLKDHRGRGSWAYRTGDGAWFKQGEFC